MYFERPGLVGKLVLIGSGSVFNPAHDQVKVLRAVLANQLPAAEDPTPERIRARNAGSTFERRDTFDEIVFAQLTAYALPDRARALRQTVEGLVATVDSTEHRVLHRLEDIAVPTLVVSGREDPRADWRHVESGCRRIPRATLRIVERCGHKPYAEQPAAFADALLEFLDR
jgi:pimeloyl-ACP methyl ester carboxylesterase